MKKILSFCLLAGCASLLNAACSDSYYQSPQGYSYDYQGQSSQKPQGSMNQNRNYQGPQGYQGQYGSSQNYQGFGSYGQGYGESTDMSHSNMDMNRDDKSMENDIRDSLRSVFSDRFNNVNVQVRNGQVTLTGTVATQEDRKDLEEKIRDMDGVRGVNNQVMVQSQKEGSSTGPKTQMNRY